MQSWGLGSDLMYLNREETLQQLGATDVLGGTFTPHCAAINPYLLVQELVHYLEKNRVLFFRNSPVIEMSPGIIRTRTGSVRAPITIRATEGYTRTIRGQKRTLAPVYSLMLATEPIPRAQIDEIGLRERQTFSDYRNLIIYGQRTSDDRIAFGGRGAPYFFGSRISDSQDRNHKVHRELWQTLTDMFPVLRDSRVTHTWGGPLGIARDWWASCGLDRSTGQGWSGGYVGDGVGTSHLGGKTLAHLITETQSELTTLPWVDHQSPPWEPEPLRWLGANAGLQIMQRADDYEDRTGKPSRAAQVVGRLLGQ
jgi:glycine/D-amino acid oxidase-like deaminating enzyme